MAFTRKLLTGVSGGVGSDGPTIYSYFGDEADLTVTALKSTNIKPNDVIIIFDGTNAPTTRGVTTAFALV